MAAAQVHGYMGNLYESLDGVRLPYLWTADFDGQRFAVRIRYDDFGGVLPMIADIWEILADEDGKEIGTAELWEVTVGDAADVIRAAVLAAINDEVERIADSQVEQRLLPQRPI
jgi:hypothetical protein